MINFGRVVTNDELGPYLPLQYGVNLQNIDPQIVDGELVFLCDKICNLTEILARYSLSLLDLSYRREIVAEVEKDRSGLGRCAHL